MNHGAPRSSQMSSRGSAQHFKEPAFLLPPKLWCNDTISFIKRSLRGSPVDHDGFGDPSSLLIFGTAQIFHARRRSFSSFPWKAQMCIFLHCSSSVDTTTIDEFGPFLSTPLACDLGLEARSENQVHTYMTSFQKTQHVAALASLIHVLLVLLAC